MGDLGSIPGSGRSPGEGNGNPLQYSCLENPMDRGAWRATVHGVSKSRIQLKDFTYGFCGPEISKKLGSKLCLDVSCEAEIRYRIDLHSSENLLGMEGPLLKWHTLLTCKLVLVIGGGPSSSGPLHMAWVCAKHGNWIIKANILRKNEGMKRERRRYLTSSKQKLYAF